MMVASDALGKDIEDTPKCHKVTVEKAHGRVEASVGCVLCRAVSFGLHDYFLLDFYSGGKTYN